MHHIWRRMSGHQLPQCWQQSHHHSGKEASRSEADLAQGLELVLVEVLGAPELEEALVLEELAALALVLAVVEDPQLANRTCLPCTSVPCRIAGPNCTSFRTGDRECHTEHVLLWLRLGNL